jgi:D-Tyr-tRNAtyr deacylase
MKVLGYSGLLDLHVVTEIVLNLPLLSTDNKSITSTVEKLSVNVNLLTFSGFFLYATRKMKRRPFFVLDENVFHSRRRTLY